MRSKFLFCLMALAISHGQAGADSDNAAYIDPEGGWCGTYNDRGEFVKSEETRILVTNSLTSGEIHLKCRFESTPTLSNKSWVDEGFVCALFLGDLGVVLTNESHLRQTPKGDIVLQCHFVS